MLGVRYRATAFAVCALLIPQSTDASIGTDAPVQPAASFIRTGQAVLAPMGYVVFCMKNPDECRLSGRRGMAAGAAGRPLNMTPAKMARLRDVNRQVNQAIAPRRDPRIGVMADQWTLSPKSGDCEDYALTKRAELMRRGFPASALRLAVARTETGEGHAVLIVRTSNGDLVLDNRQDQITAWRNARLLWVAIQSTADPRRWHSVAPSVDRTRIVKAGL